MDSQNCPSEVEASPIVQKQTSFPLFESSVNWCRDFMFLKLLEAKASPRARVICPPVVEISELMFLRLARSSQLPLPSTNGVAKWEFICRPALKGSCLISGSA